MSCSVALNYLTTTSGVLEDWRKSRATTNKAYPLGRFADALTWCWPPRRSRIESGSTLGAPTGAASDAFGKSSIERAVDAW